MANYLWGILSDVMMRETAGIQIGVDFKSEEDAMRKFRLANLMMPFSTAMFANSRYISSGAVGLNLGGLVKDVKVKASILTTSHGQMVAGLVGNIVKTNASISGAEVGCQGEASCQCVWLHFWFHQRHHHGQRHEPCDDRHRCDDRHE